MFQAIALSLTLVVSAFAARQEDPMAAMTARAKAEMKKLDFATGEWKGEGWTILPNGEKSTSGIVEKFDRKIDGLVLVVEGRGAKNVDGKEVVTHQAFGVISFNPFKSAWEMKSWVGNGYSVDAWVKPVEKGFDWGFDVPSMKVKYAMRINEKGQWVENGERSMDGGKTWTHFFSMTLDQIKK